MEFDENHKTKLETLNYIEAEEFIDFLQNERKRHMETYTRCNARARFWESEAIRQSKEIGKIEERIAEVQKKWNLVT